MPDPGGLENTPGSTINAGVHPFDQIPVAAIGIDAAGVIMYVNGAALADFCLNRGSLIGLPFFQLFTDVSPDKSSETALLERRPIKEQEFTINVMQEQHWTLISSCTLTEDNEATWTYVFIRDITRSRKRDSLFAYLNRAAASLAKTRDTDSALKEIARFIVPSFADWFTVDVIKGDGLDLILLEHEDPAKVVWAYQYRKNYPPDLNGNSGSAVVLKTGKPGFVPVVTKQMINMTVTDAVQREEVTKIGLHSVIMAPMWTDDRITGLVNFISSRPEHHFDEEDLDFALNFASLIGLALENTRLNENASREIKLRTQGEERFKFLLDAIPHKMWTSGPDGRATYYNRQWHDYTGIDGFENLREKIWGLIHPDDVAAAAALWPEAVKNGTDMETEHRLQQYDGAYRWHLSRFRAQKDKLDQVTMWVGTSTDIHDQKSYELALAAANEKITGNNEELFAANEELEAANEEQLATNEELVEAQRNLENAIRDMETGKRQFQLFLDSIPQIAWSSAESGEVVYYNRRWYEYTGLTFEETRNWGWKQVIHPDDLEHNMERLTAIIQSRQQGEFEIREKRADGDYRWHLVRLSPLFSPEGDLEQWFGTATDIDELKQLQQQKDDFISIASHELKTPLTSLKANIQLLHRMKDKVSPDKLPQLIDQAHRSVYKMTALVDDLLNVSKVKEPQFTIQKKWFILSELVNACCNHITLAGSHEVVISGDKTLKAYADEGTIDQVIVNFVNNAIKYAPASKEILVIIEREGAGVKLSVKDRGPGIPPEQVPFLFNRYYQAGKQNYRNPGLGLGLYICSEIIKRHGGKIGVESEVGYGTAFWFTLPDSE